MSDDAINEPVLTLTSGPVAADPRVLRALSRPIQYDCDASFQQFYERVNEKLTRALKSDTPALIPPYGYLFLGNPFFRLQTSTLPPNGVGVYNDTLPNDPGLSGTTFGYFQGWARFNSGPGVGSFANYEPLEVE